MKILLIHPFLQVGGAEQVIIRIANYFVSKKYSVGIVCLYNDEKYMYPLHEKVHIYMPSRFISNLCKKQRLFLLLCGIPILTGLTIWHCLFYDVLFPHNFPSIFCAAFAHIFSNKPIIWEFNETASKSAIIHTIETYTGRVARIIIVLDKKNKNYAQTYFKRPTAVIRPGIDSAYWSKAVSPLLEYKNKIVLLSVGKLHPQKNQILLITVLPLLLMSFPSLHLVLVGKGPDEERLIQKVKDLHLEMHVTFSRAVSNTYLRRLYKTATLVCFPALDQTWGLTPFEALCQKTTSIVSTQAGAAEVLAPNNLAFFAKPTPDSFRRTIEGALNEKAKRRVIGEKGKTYVTKHLTWNNFCQQITDMVIKIT